MRVIRCGDALMGAAPLPRLRDLRPGVLSSVRQVRYHLPRQRPSRRQACRPSQLLHLRPRSACQGIGTQQGIVAPSTQRLTGSSRGKAASPFEEGRPSDLQVRPFHIVRTDMNVETPIPNLAECRRFHSISCGTGAFLLKSHEVIFTDGEQVDKRLSFNILRRSVGFVSKESGHLPPRQFTRYGDAFGSPATRIFDYDPVLGVRIA